MLKRKRILFVFFICSIRFYSQELISEFGVFSGVVSMQSDYGERGHFGSSYANIGYGIGGAYYLSFNNFRSKWYDRTTNLKEHLRLKTTLSYMSINLIQRGIYTLGTTEQTVLYNAMKGKSTTFNYGLQFEYTLFNLSDEKKIEPYFNFGFLGNRNSPKLESSLGNISNNPELIPTVYTNSVFLKKNNSTAFVIGIGTRIKVKKHFNSSFYLIDFRMQRFNSDIIDGLKPTLNANKYNDWLLFLNIGYVFK